MRAERSQWENERGRLVDVFRSITDAILLLDAEGLLLFANDEAAKRLGLDAAGGKSEGKTLALLLVSRASADEIDRAGIQGGQ